MRTLLFACALIAVVAIPQPADARAPAGGTALPSAVQETYAFAVKSFRQHRYAAAYGRFARLADAGHVPSAQVALMMYSNGPMLFGSQWDATPEQVEYWRALVLKDDRGA
jgi:hypothetical protein